MKHICIYILIISSILDAQANTEIKDYFSKSSEEILSNNYNQFILGSAALAAFASLTIDQKINHMHREMVCYLKKFHILVICMVGIGHIG